MNEACEGNVHASAGSILAPAGSVRRSGHDRVVVIEDVITTGGSALRAAEAVQRAGATVSGILALVDREEGGRGVLEAQGFAVICLATLSELLEQEPVSGTSAHAS